MFNTYLRAIVVLSHTPEYNFSLVQYTYTVYNCSDVEYFPVFGKKQKEKRKKLHAIEKKHLAPQPAV